MRVQIIGAGGVGLLLGSFLAEVGATVHFVTRNEQQANLLRTHYLLRTNQDESIDTYNVSASTELHEEMQMTIVAVKYGQLASLWPQLQNKDQQIPLLFLQNGLAHYEEALQLSHEQIAFSSVQFGAEKVAGNHVVHRGIGAMKIAVARGGEGVFQPLQALRSGKLPVSFEEDAEQMLLEKALLNCFVNPMTAVLQMKNGALVSNANAFQLLQLLYNEIIVAFPAVEELIPFANVVGLCERTAENTSSMLADRLKDSETEVETIVGAVLKKAQREGQAMPILQTLYYLVKASEKSGEKM